MHMSEGDLQANKEVDNVYQNDHIWTSGPQLDNGPERASHSLTDLNINDEVDKEKLYIFRSSRNEETSSLDPESESEDA